MELIKSIDSIRSVLATHQQKGVSVGLVPTMGYLHQGHVALVRKSREQNDITVVSIYVNPTQFNNPTDLEKYPRDESHDTELLLKEACDVVFAPGDDEMYPFSPKIAISFGSLEERMEGEFRPGHFRGVGLVVAKLLNIINPTRAYFGEKDLQQLLVVRQLVSELKFGTEIVGVPTVREPSGLALSSRNARLSEEDKVNALVISKALEAGKTTLIESRDVDTAKRVALDVFSNHYAEIKPEYLEIMDFESGELMQRYTQGKMAICTAAVVAGVRLIDNVIFQT